MTLFFALLACAPDYKDVPVKTVGVGYDPEEIGPSPTPYGGVVEYTWVNFAGGGLSLALMQLGSFDEVGPGLSGFAPPYAAVYGFSYIFTEKLAAADSMGGVTSVPPAAENTCYTTFEATGPIGSFKTVDVGDYMEFVTEDGTGGLRLDRNPAQYLSDPEGAFAYYNAVELWHPTPMYGLVPGDNTRVENMSQTLLSRATFPSGERVTYKFPGGVVPKYAPLGSIPAPSSVVEETSMKVPSLPGGVQMEWNGPRYDAHGFVTTSSGDQSTCLAFGADAVENPQGPAECVAAMSTDSQNGNMYTGPWDTKDGQVLFRWEPGTDPDEVVSLSVRFLGPVDRADPNFMRQVVEEPTAKSTKQEWNIARGDTVPDEEVGTATRAPTACEAGAEYAFDTNYLTAAGELVPSLRGDPFHNMSEVTCRLEDDGEFALTNDIVADALLYAQSHGGEGAVFYFARSTEAEVEVPDAMDNYGARKVISPIAVASRAVDIGRFWFEE